VWCRAGSKNKTPSIGLGYILENQITIAKVKEKKRKKDKKDKGQKRKTEKNRR